MTKISILVTIGLLSCSGQKPLEKHSSPSGEYVLQVELDNSRPNDEHLGFRLLNKNGEELDYLRTLAGNHMKWAVSWYADRTIILDSHDVGTYGWTIDNDGQLKAMYRVSRAMEDSCIEEFKRKYGPHGIQH